VSQITRRQAMQLFAALGAAGLTASCAFSSPNDDQLDDIPVSHDPVRIGLLLPQSGPQKAVGDDLLRGFQLYLSLNGNQLGGHPVAMVIADEGTTVREGVAGLNKLLGKGVHAISGVANPDTMLALRDPIRQARVPLVGSNASPFSLQGEVFIWRTSYTGNDPGFVMGQYMAENTSGKIVLALPEAVASQDILLGYLDGFGTGDRLVRSPVYTGDVANPPRGAFAKSMKVIAAQHPSAVFCSYSGAAAVEFIREYRSSGIDAVLYGTGFLTEGGTVAALGDQANGIFTGMNYSADLPIPANRVFASAYRKAHGTSPTSYAMASYDAAHVLDRAIQLAGNALNAQQINLMLGRVGQVDSPRGVWQFNQSRTPQQKWYLREVRKDGQVPANMVLRELITRG